MNTSHTAFRVSNTGKELFQTIDKEFNNYKQFNLSANTRFLEN